MSRKRSSIAPNVPFTAPVVVRCRPSVVPIKGTSDIGLPTSARKLLKSSSQSRATAPHGSFPCSRRQPPVHSIPIVERPIRPIRPICPILHACRRRREYPQVSSRSPAAPSSLVKRHHRATRFSASAPLAPAIGSSRSLHWLLLLPPPAPSVAVSCRPLYPIIRGTDHGPETNE